MPGCCTLPTKPRFQTFERLIQEPTPLPVYQKELEGLVTLSDPMALRWVEIQLLRHIWKRQFNILMSRRGNLCPILQRKANKALRSSSFDPTHHSDFGRYVTSPIHEGIDPPSRPLLTMIFHRKIREKQENKSPKQKKTLTSKQEWSLTSVLQAVAQQESQHSIPWKETFLSWISTKTAMNEGILVPRSGCWVHTQSYC